MQFNLDNRVFGKRGGGEPDPMLESVSSPPLIITTAPVDETSGRNFNKTTYIQTGILIKTKKVSF